MIWLDKIQLAERLGVHPKTAEKMMMEMHPVAISGKIKKRWRVSEENFEKWMLKRSIGTTAPVGTLGCGTTRKLKRRG